MLISSKETDVTRLLCALAVTESGKIWPSTEKIFQFATFYVFLRFELNYTERAICVTSFQDPRIRNL